MAVEDIKWTNLTYLKTCLAYITRGHELLLIEKKTGLGKGKIMGPGGKLELGESFKEAMKREIHEEVGLDFPLAEIKERADVYFCEIDGPAIWTKVFIGELNFSAKLSESQEARPFWCAMGNLPFAKMWKNDCYWLPGVLSGSYVQACFLTQGEEILSAYTELSSRPLKSLHRRVSLREP